MKSKVFLTLILGTGLGFGVGAASLIEPAFAEPQVVKDYNPSITLAPLVEKMSPAVVNIEIEFPKDNALVINK